MYFQAHIRNSGGQILKSSQMFLWSHALYFKTYTTVQAIAETLSVYVLFLAISLMNIHFRLHSLLVIMQINFNVGT